MHKAAVSKKVHPKAAKPMNKRHFAAKKPSATHKSTPVTPSTSSTLQKPGFKKVNKNNLPAFATHSLATDRSTRSLGPLIWEQGANTQAEFQQQSQYVEEILSGAPQPSILSRGDERSVSTVVHPEKLRRGFESHLVHDGQDPSHVHITKAPAANVLVLPASSKIGRKYVDDIRSGKVIEQMYNELTHTTNLQEVYTSNHTYVHWFRIHERSQRDFLKRLGLIETKLNQRFGSTYYLHVSKALPKYRKRFTILRGPFVHKKAQDTYEYNQNEYICKISYAFAITDPEINDFIYNQLKTQVIASGAGISFGWDVKLTKPKVRRQQYTPLTSSAIKKDGLNEDISQIKYSNYVGQQELLRLHCETNELDFKQFAGDQKLFPFRDRILRAREKQLMRTIAEQKGHSFDSDAFNDSLSELSDLAPTDLSDNASEIMRL